MQSIYKTNELFRKFNLFSQYRNVNEIPNNVDKVTLFITLSKNMSLKNIVKAFALLELITGSRPYFVRAKKSSILLKRRKGAPIGVKITLRKKKARLLILKLVWEVLPKINDLSFNYNFKKDSKNSSVLSFQIKDPFVFSELKNFYFFFKDVGTLKVICSFNSSNTKEETFFKSRLVQLPFN
jgi:large subunit ribosomal protein L5